MLVHPLDLVCVYVRSRHLNRCRKVDDDLIVRSCAPLFLYSGADIQCKIKLGSGKTLRRVLKDYFSVVIFHIFLYHAGTIDRDLLYFLAVCMEYNLTL